MYVISVALQSFSLWDWNNILVTYMQRILESFSHLVYGIWRTCWCETKQQKHSPWIWTEFSKVGLHSVLTFENVINTVEHVVKDRHAHKLKGFRWGIWGKIRIHALFHCSKTKWTQWLICVSQHPVFYQIVQHWQNWQEVKSHIITVWIFG